MPLTLHTIPRRLSSPRALLNSKVSESSTVKSMDSSTDSEVCIREAITGGGGLSALLMQDKGRGQMPIREQQYLLQTHAI